MVTKASNIKLTFYNASIHRKTPTKTTTNWTLLMFSEIFNNHYKGLRTIIIITYINHLDTCSACPPCLQLWHHENQLPNDTICDESVSLVVVVVPMYIKQIAHLGSGFRQFGQQDI